MNLTGFVGQSCACVLPSVKRAAARMARNRDMVYSPVSDAFRTPAYNAHLQRRYRAECAITNCHCKCGVFLIRMAGPPHIHPAYALHFDS
jgi:hypothetical protein